MTGAAVGGVIGVGAGAASGAVLAGSATATAAQVVVGAKAVTAIATSVGGGGGLVAAGKMIADNLSQAVNRVPQVFWSGGLDRQAEKLAQSVGGKSLEMTRLGQFLTSIEANASAWNAASANFANIARGVAYSLQNSAGVRIASVWATVEYPILIQSNVQIVFQTFYQQLFK